MPDDGTDVTGDDRSDHQGEVARVPADGLYQA
jgi:hypothetical protein